MGASGRGCIASKSTCKPRECLSSHGYTEVARGEILTRAFFGRVACGAPGEVWQNKSGLEMMRFRPSIAVLRLQWVQTRGGTRGQQEGDGNRCTARWDGFRLASGIGVDGGQQSGVGRGDAGEAVGWLPRSGVAALTQVARSAATLSNYLEWPWGAALDAR